MSIVSTGTQIIGKKAASVAEGRFATEMGKVTRQLNRIAIAESRSAERMCYTFPKATPEDLVRLTSPKLKDAGKRVTWTNPKDNKVYHILEEGRENGKVQVRILDKDGAFVKNAELEPKNIVIYDNFFSPRGITHGEMMETFIKRFNPFANVERLEHKKGLYDFIRYYRRNPMHLDVIRFNKLAADMEKGKKVDYISVSESHLVDAEDVIGRTGMEQQEYVGKSAYIKGLRPLFRRILNSGTRILEASGNEKDYAKVLVSDRLAIEGVEGVGSLRAGKVAQDSCSRNSVFTQHYERRDFVAKPVVDENNKVIGVNVTGRTGADLPLNWKTKKLIGRHFGGTSYATPVRVAKLSLNDMMQGVV